MVLQIASDLGYVSDNGNAVAAEVVSVADPGEKQQLRRVVRPGAQDDFAFAADGASFAAVGDDYAHGSSVLQLLLLHDGSHSQVQVGAVQRRQQVSLDRAPPGAVVDERLGDV